MQNHTHEKYKFSVSTGDAMCYSFKYAASLTARTPKWVPYWKKEGRRLFGKDKANGASMRDLNTGKYLRRDYISRHPSWKPSPSGSSSPFLW